MATFGDYKVAKLPSYYENPDRAYKGPLFCLEVTRENGTTFCVRKANGCIMTWKSYNGAKAKAKALASLWS